MKNVFEIWLVQYTLMFQLPNRQHNGDSSFHWKCDTVKDLTNKHPETWFPGANWHLPHPQYQGRTHRQFWLKWKFYFILLSTFNFSWTALQNSSNPSPFKADMQTTSSLFSASNLIFWGLPALSTCHKQLKNWCLLETYHVARSRRIEAHVRTE